MTEPATKSSGAMSFLEHLDELRSRLFKAAIAYLVLFATAWFWADAILNFLMQPMRNSLFAGGDIIFVNVTEPFFVFMKASALAALFVAAPYLLYQVWAFIAPGLYKNERWLAAGFIFFGTLFFVAGGAFGFYVAVPLSVQWLVGLGSSFKAQLTLASAFSFLSRVVLGMGAVFELPIVIVFLARVGLVTPASLMKYFRHAVVVIAIVAAVITPTGDALTMSVFAVPMILLYLLGVGVAWLVSKKKDA